MGKVCGTYGRRDRCAEGFGEGDLRKRDHLQNLGLDGRIILKCIYKKWNGGMDQIYLAQNSDRWWALVNAVMNFRIPQNAGNFLIDESLLASQEELCSMLLVS
jgi:hypothetical protein